MCASTFKTDELIPCQCGFKPDSYKVYYGRTPYDVICPVCHKQTTMAKCKVTGCNGNVIDYWNSHIAKMTLAEMEAEAKEFYEEQKRKTSGFDGYDTYLYYWVKDQGEILIT